MTDRIVHVCNGDSTASSLELAELPGDIVVWADALDQGPVLAVGDAEHYKVRGDYWASRGETGAAEKLAQYDRDFDAAGSASELVLWFEHDLFDQLALSRLLARLARRTAPAQLTHVSLVSIDRHPEVPQFLGLGQLKPEQLAALWPRRTPLSRDALDEAIIASIAVTSADPRALPFLVKRIKAMPFLAGAIERQLEELPDATSGMTRTERQLLAAIARGESNPGALMVAVHGIDPRYPITDGLLTWTLRTLVNCGFVADAAVTPLGRQALAGAIDRVHECGIDDWRGAVRLVGRGPVWRWDSRERKLLEK